jgi:hypothetical protein
MNHGLWIRVWFTSYDHFVCLKPNGFSHFQNIFVFSELNVISIWNLESNYEVVMLMIIKRKRLAVSSKQSFVHRFIFILIDTTADSNELVITEYFFKITFLFFSSLTKSITCFEDLSNDIIYEIFDFLDFRHAYDAFSDVNKRFQNLLTNLTLPIHIDMSSMSKSDFQKYYKQIIIPDTHRIKSLHLSNPFSVNTFLTHNGIVSKLIRLETLVLHDIHSKDLLNLLTYLISLPCLSSLVISNIDEGTTTQNLHHEIFRLPMLKYCKISFNEHLTGPSLPIAINEHSPIEHLIINNRFAVHELMAVLSYTPQLRRLSLGGLWHYLYEQITLCSIKLDHLTHASLNISGISFDVFEILTKHLLFQLQVLYVTAENDKTYLDGDRWKRLILSSMPYLRIFDIRWKYFSLETVYAVDSFIIESFRSKFWVERQWYFTSILGPADDDCYQLFFSTNPYRYNRRSFYLNSICSYYFYFVEENLIHYMEIKPKICH